MANLEVLALDTAVPQIRAPGAGDGYSVPRDMTMASGTTLAAQAVTSTSLGTTGNLTFSGTAQRITGDMSNATITNRLLFQNSVTNAATNFQVIPNGTAIASGFIAYASASDPGNTSIFQARIGLDNNECVLYSNRTGTGTYLPMTFYTGGTERMRIDSSGNVGIGGTASALAKVEVTGTLPTSSNFTSSIYLSGTIPSGTTNQYWGVRSLPTTQAASFALSELKHFVADPQAFGAGSTVTYQYGFLVESGLTGATNNYGFFSNIASGSNRWNFYANGTAANYFAGDTLIGTSTNATGIVTRFLTKASADYAASAVFESDGSAANWARTDWKNANIATPGIIYMDQAGLFSIRNDGNYPIAFYTNGGNERMRITNAGNIVAGASAALATTATDGFLYVPTCAGTPTGTPTAITGMAPIVVDTTNNKLYFYSGGQWRDAGP